MSGPQGSSGAAAFGEVLSGPQAVAPVRKLVHNQDEQGEGQEEGEEGERDEQGLEEEDEAEEEGVCECSFPPFLPSTRPSITTHSVLPLITFLFFPLALAIAQTCTAQLRGATSQELSLAIATRSERERPVARICSALLSFVLRVSCTVFVKCE